MGLNLTLEGRAEEAVAYLERALKINPDNVSALVNMSYALVKLGKMTQATETCARALKLDPQNETARFLMRKLQGQKGK